MDDLKMTVGAYLWYMGTTFAIGAAIGGAAVYWWLK